MWNYMLLRLEDEVHWVILRIHHIISDGQSMLLFLNDLADNYARILLDVLSGRMRNRTIRSLKLLPKIDNISLINSVTSSLRTS
ncbi:condensation domain-containing protein [Paenibacillus sp. S33]